MACAVLDFEPAIIPDFSYLSHDVEYDDVQQIATDAALYTPEAFEADSKRALESETVEEVEALLAFAFATPAQTYDMVRKTVVGFVSKDLQHEDYRSMFHAAARVALERSQPLLFQEWLAGNDGGDIPALIGAELCKLRPAQLVFKPLSQYMRKRKTKSTARFLGWS